MPTVSYRDWGTAHAYLRKKKGVTIIPWVMLLIVLVVAGCTSHTDEVRVEGDFVHIPQSLVPAPGDQPLHIPEQSVWLVNLVTRDDTRGGLLALSSKHPISAYRRAECEIVWLTDFVFMGINGWFRDACVGATFDPGGVLVFGPPTRSMDTFDLAIRSDGTVVINTAVVHQQLGQPTERR